MKDYAYTSSIEKALSEKFEINEEANYKLVAEVDQFQNLFIN
jgi:hypothetical protein